MNYDKKLLKRKYQKKFFNQITNKKLFVGLCGTNPAGYLKIIKSCGFKQIFLFDNNWHNLNHPSIQKYKVKVRLNNINAFIGNYDFMDLDYCCCINSIKHLLHEVMKIKEFTMTLALRPVSEEKTLSILSKYKRNFLYRVYVEKGCPMMIIYFPSKNNYK
ncbi:MAG: hypothetical protein ACEQSQ_06145 [Candidatus Paceibacteria bacterium]